MDRPLRPHLAKLAAEAKRIATEHRNRREENRLNAQVPVEQTFIATTTTKPYGRR